MPLYFASLASLAFWRFNCDLTLAGVCGDNMFLPGRVSACQPGGGSRSHGVLPVISRTRACWIVVLALAGVCQAELMLPKMPRKSTEKPKEVPAAPMIKWEKKMISDNINEGHRRLRREQGRQARHHRRAELVRGAGLQAAPAPRGRDRQRGVHDQQRRARLRRERRRLDGRDRRRRGSPTRSTGTRTRARKGLEQGKLWEAAPDRRRPGLLRGHAAAGPRRRRHAGDHRQQLGRRQAHDRRFG